jgi:hypothetical protein
MEGGEIRLAGFGAQAGEFRDIDANGVIALGIGIFEGFEVFGRFSRHNGLAGWRLKIQSWKNQARTIPESVEFLTVLGEFWMFHASICMSILCRRRCSGILLA